MDTSQTILQKERKRVYRTCFVEKVNPSKKVPLKKAESFNSKYAREVSGQRMSTLSGIMEALTDDNVIIIGVYGTDSVEKANLLEKVSRRANRDNLFNVVVMASVTKKPDLKRIQGQIAVALDLTMEEKNIEERAGRLRDRIKIEQKILIILQDLYKGLDLEKLGIPFGANHTGCKILLTSTSEEI